MIKLELKGEESRVVTDALDCYYNNLENWYQDQKNKADINKEWLDKEKVRIAFLLEQLEIKKNKPIGSGVLNRRL